MLCFILPWADLLKCHRGAHLHGNHTASDISTNTLQPMEAGERMRGLTRWNPVVQFRRCNLCNFVDYAFQGEHEDFWFNKQVKHAFCCYQSLSPRPYIHIFLRRLTDKWAQPILFASQSLIWMCCGLWERKKLMLCKVECRWGRLILSSCQGAFADLALKSARVLLWVLCFWCNFSANLCSCRNKIDVTFSL